MRQLKSIFRSGRSVLFAGLLVALPALIVGLEYVAQADYGGSANVVAGRPSHACVR
jgi:hypothetical protein